MPIHQDLSTVRRNKPNDHVEGGGFSCAIGPKQTHYFALIDVEGYTVNYSAPTIGFANIVGRECLHLLFNLGRTCRVGWIRTYEHPIIATKKSQRMTGHSALFGIKNARQI